MRKETNRLYEMLAEGVITHQQVVDMCLGAMSEDDVALMLDNNELSERFLEEEDEELDDDNDGQPDEAQEWHDFDPDC